MTAEPWGAQLPDPQPRGPAAERLALALAEIIEAGTPPPCAEALTGRDRWYADQPWMRRQAAALCRDLCPVLDECHAAADEGKEVHGVWGGVLRGRKATTPKAHQGTGGRA